MQNLLTLFVILALILLSPISASAKRSSPAPVPPVVWNGVEYRAPLDVKHMGYVQALELQSNKMLWETKVYHVWIMPLAEKDTQWVFISNMEIQDGKLLVQNEKGRTFKLDLRTGRIEDASFRWIVWLCGSALVVLGLFVLKRKTSARPPFLLSGKSH